MFFYFLACAPAPVTDLSQLQGYWHGSYTSYVDPSQDSAGWVEADLDLWVDEQTEEVLFGVLFGGKWEDASVVHACQAELPRPAHLRLFNCFTHPADGEEPSPEAQLSFTDVTTRQDYLYLGGYVLQRSKVLGFSYQSEDDQ
ncbi:MAG TPA: hypothetical protein PKY30_15155 [Myxococcota bacterium]|nr:hypothetical protein [Myxococcota bacterium]